MTKKEKLYVAALTGLFVLMILLEMAQPKPVNWEHTYHKNDKIPYGNYLLYALLKDQSYPNTIQDISDSYYEEQKTGNKFIAADNQHLLFIGDAYDPNEQDLGILLDYVNEGGTAFLAANNFPLTLSDTLSFYIKTDFFFGPEDNTNEKDITSQEGMVPITLTNNLLAKPKGYSFKRDAITFYLQEKEGAPPFETLAKNYNGKPIFVTQKFGEGRFYIHCNPLLFTNYHMLTEDGSAYVAAILSYLPDGTILWDSYQQGIQVEPRTPIRFILQQVPLRWAWYLSLALLALWILFQSKRRQRKIPVVLPPANTTLEFVETIGQLHFQQKQHHQLAKKKIRFFREMLKKKFFIRRDESVDSIVIKLANQTTFKQEELKKIIEFIEVLDLKEPVSEQELLMLENYSAKLANA